MVIGPAGVVRPMVQIGKTGRRLEIEVPKETHVVLLLKT